MSVNKSNDKIDAYIDLAVAQRKVFDAIVKKIKTCSFYAIMASLWLSLILLAIFKPLNFLPAGSVVRDISYILLGLVPSGACFGTSVFLLNKKYTLGRITSDLANDIIIRLMRRNRDFDHSFSDMIAKEHMMSDTNAAQKIAPTVYSGVSGSARVGSGIDFPKSHRRSR